jgi:hypothetical protein
MYKHTHMKITILIALMLVTGLSQAQTLKDSDVPAAVKTAFAKSFPNAKGTKWSKEGESEYEAEFKNGSLTQAANFDMAGKWLITETEIRKSDLPQAVQASLKKDFEGFKFEEIEKAETPDQGTFYEMELEKGEKSYEVQIAADGKVMKKTEKKEGKEKD